MATVPMSYFPIARAVDELFSTHRYGQNCENPVTGAGYVHGIDPVKPQKEVARRALLAREWFAIYGPPDAQPLPFWRDHKGPGLLGYIVKLYARSLEDRDYDINAHPPFADYVSGVLWEAERVDGIIGKLPNYPAELPELKKRFPPRELAGMGPGFCWLPPKVYAKVMPDYRRSMARQAEFHKRIKTQPILPAVDESTKILEAVRRAAARANSSYQASKVQT
jgi:hypothetical protein